MTLTRREQEKGAMVIRRWPVEERRFVVSLPAPERDFVVLAAALLDLAPSSPVLPDDEIIELP